jgi:hypothetical protein
MEEPRIALKLPSSNYGAFCCKILIDFMKHHNIQTHLPVPNHTDKNIDALSKIIDIMVETMGEEKRKEILADLNKYKISLPACFRD